MTVLGPGSFGRRRVYLFDAALKHVEGALTALLILTHTNIPIGKG